MGKKLTVLVTGVGGRSFGNGIMHSLLLFRDKYRIVATDATNFSHGLYEADAKYSVPYGSSPDYIAAIHRLVKREKIDVILPGSQPEVMALASNQEEFKSRCCLIISPVSVVGLCLNKMSLYTWLSENGYKVPRTATFSEWQALVRDCGFPIIGKPTEDTGGSKNVCILRDKDEVSQYLAEGPDNKIVFQEYVGSPDEEYTIGVMVSKEGEIIDSIVIHRKLIGLSLGVSRIINGRSYALSTGYSQGYVVRHPQIKMVCESLAHRMGIRGPVNMQLRMVDGNVVFLEVHPRFSGTTPIRADVDFNEPDILIRNFVFGETFGRLEYRTDVAAIRAFKNVIVPVEEMNNVQSA